jgi:hypothetical protein
MAGDWPSFQKESFRASGAPCSHPSWEDFLSIYFCQCLALGIVDEYS